MGEHIASKASASCRLVQAREVKFKTSADFARAVGHNPITVRAHEAGQNGIPPEVACEYAKALEVSPAWLIFGDTEAAEMEAMLERLAEGYDNAEPWDLDRIVEGIEADFRTMKAKRGAGL